MTTFYVSQNGSDTNTGLASTSAWKSVSKANAAVQPGDTVQLSGTFTKQVIFPARSGNAAAPITYTGGTFDQPGLVGTTPYVCYLGARSYIVIDGVTFTNTNYVNAPVTNKGVVLRSARFCIFRNCTFTNMQMQLIGSDDNQIVNNTWRYFVASYVNPATGKPDPNHPTSSGDMLAIMVGSDRNTVAFNDMRYAGHSLIQVSSATGSEVNAGNQILDNTLSNPWYKPLILADDGAGTVVRGNTISDACTEPTLYSTIPGNVGQIEDASAGLQISGKNFVVDNNTFANNVADYGVISLGSRWYFDANHPAGVKVESTGNQITNNTVTGSQAASSVSFVQFESAADANAGRPVPQLTGNTFTGNTFTGNVGTSASWNGQTLYTTFLMHAATMAPPWPAGGYGGNTVTGNQFDSATNANLFDVTYNGHTTHVVQDLSTFEAACAPEVAGNVPFGVAP